MHICAVSDLHGRLPAIPPCDVLILAGDIAPDFGNPWIPDIMRQRQTEWLDTTYREWEQTVPAKHILAVPGNHDWFFELPEGLKTRLFVDEGCEILDETTDTLKTFWFTPWVEPCGNWNYQLDRARRYDRWAPKMPCNLDVLVAHGPAHKVCDIAFGGNTHAGCPMMRAMIQARTPANFCYGHIHEAQRYGGPKHHLGKTTTYCCSMWGDNWTPVVFEL